MSSKSIYTAQKFLISCSCVICKKEITSQTIIRHYASHFKKAESSTAIKKCEKCGSTHQKVGKYCSRSCANSRTQSELSNSLRRTANHSKFPAYIKIKQCKVCGKWHKNSGVSCSLHCKKHLLRLAALKRMEAGWNPQNHRCRSSPSFLEISFSNWMQNFPQHKFITEKAFNCNGKMYYGDFFFPHLNLLVELDGEQHQNSKDYDSLRDLQILSHFNVYTLRITYSEYFAKTKMHILEKIFSMEP